MFRFALKHMLLATVLIAICAIAMTTGTWFWARVLFTVVLVANLGAILGAVFLHGWPRAFWTGFALFGWTCWLIATHPLLQIAEHQLFVNEVARMLKEYTPEANDGLVILHNTHGIAIFSFERIIHSVFGLTFSFLGGLVGCWVYSSRDRLVNSKAGQ